MGRELDENGVQGFRGVMVMKKKKREKGQSLVVRYRRLRGVNRTLSCRRSDVPVQVSAMLHEPRQTSTRTGTYKYLLACIPTVAREEGQSRQTDRVTS